MTVLIKRVELNITALGVLLLVAVHLGTQSAWAGDTQCTSPSPSKPRQADEPSPVEQPNDRLPEQRLGPLARRFQEIIFSDDLRTACAGREEVLSVVSCQLKEMHGTNGQDRLTVRELGAISIRARATWPTHQPQHHRITA